ncbi:MAG: twin-arginine translocation signal domain-containing protein, partial [Planctomycetaceae bacterium]|nr:twin-arginine translocation signal domain-containing protein [Planctomycetaceae bacterium]
MTISKFLLQQASQRLDPQVGKSAWLHNRRHFLQGSGISIAAAALSSLLGQESTAAKRGAVADQRVGGLTDVPHFPPTAKRVIYL